MVEIIKNIHSIDGLLYPIPGVGIIPYLFIEGPDDLTLIDTGFVSDISKLENYLTSTGYNITSIKRIVLTHVHVDHVQAVNELKKRSGAKLYCHWADAGYLAYSPPYHGPPYPQTIQDLLKKFGVSMDEVIKKFGGLEREPVIVDKQVSDGDRIGSLKVIHTPGHTPGHMSLYSEDHRTIFGADLLFKSVFGVDGLYVPPSMVSIDLITAAISARRISQIRFDRLLLAHQDSPILQDAREEVEKAAYRAIEQQQQQQPATA
jgi:glyoxylase-like metal-dependent hydrolase (beta-lactamase superfamily II)